MLRNNCVKRAYRETKKISLKIKTIFTILRNRVEEQYIERMECIVGK